MLISSGLQRALAQFVPIPYVEGKSTRVMDKFKELLCTTVIQLDLSAPRSPAVLPATRSSQKEYVT